MGNKRRVRKSEQPCWTCKNYVNGCNWAKYRLPVEGWKATEGIIKGYKKNMKTYHIEYCPEYIKG